MRDARELVCTETTELGRILKAGAPPSQLSRVLLQRYGALDPNRQEAFVLALIGEILTQRAKLSESRTPDQETNDG